ncbi:MULTISPECIES: hypothetical protein [Leeuwenhoekiella]|uniref:hypothetical protein n=1 Tax=Leeuwenhoekiella TaxID=283735 RepID=UPI000C4D3C8C|nr:MULTISPECIES: hypothetical protein [Leeuwenhoekiella]MAO41927.1 hypothetical protein [Leeuwenhoekiella sp.]|tara:strand:+ start:693 stop:1358 length:666 start_codon:yes stop_codon:yes gene_type:complete
MTEAENEYIKKIVSENIPVISDPKEDQEIQSESSKQNYLSLITENIRSNNRAIQRNSLILVVSVAVYFLVLWDYIMEVNVLSFQLTDKNILLNGIAVLFSYLYMANIIRWYNNIDLRIKFDKLAKDLYKIGSISDTLNAIRPFSILFHGLDYQTEKKDLKRWMKWPGIFLQTCVIFGPIIFNIYLIINVFRLNTFNLIACVCGLLTFLITVNTIIYAAKSR